MQKKEIPGKPYFYLFISFILTLFCTGFQNVSVFAWFQPFFLLCYISGKDNHIAWLFLSIVPQALATTFSWAGILNDPEFNGINVALVLGFSFIYNILLSLVVYFSYVRITQRYSHLGELVIVVFPTLYTALQFIAQYSPFGDIFSLAYSQIDWGVLMRFASIFGISGITFVICLFAAVIHYYGYIHGKSVPNKPVNKKIVIMFIVLFVLVLLFGGFTRSTYGSAFYQKPLSSTIPDFITAACLIDQFPTSNLTDVLNRTQNLARNHRLVLWSETAVSISEQDEDDFLLNISSIASASNTFIGATYILQLTGDSPNQKNMLALVSENGDILFKYQKTHPVPFVEAEVQPGPGDLYSEVTSIGRISGAICFDLNYPWSIIQAAKQNVDLFLQPSWNWGPIGKWHSEINAIRAVELGFHTFRCSSIGYSGVFSPKGETLSTHPSLVKGDIEKFYIPLTKRIWTWYGLFGDVLAWCCIVLSILIYLPLAYMPIFIIEKILSPFKNSELSQKLLPITKE